MRSSRQYEGLAFVVISVLGGCSRDTEPTFARDNLSTSAPARNDPAVAAAAPAAAAQANESDWPQVSRKDDVPVCLFSSWADWKQTEYIDRVPPSAQLRTGHTINFGVFGPGCASPDCVRDPMLQCWVDMDGKVIKLSARYSAFEKPDVTCANDCLPVTAQCNTPQLEKGEYTVVYGKDTWKLRVPSVVRPACR